MKKLRKTLKKNSTKGKIELCFSAIGSFDLSPSTRKSDSLNVKNNLKHKVSASVKIFPLWGFQSGIKVFIRRSVFTIWMCISYLTSDLFKDFCNMLHSYTKAITLFFCQITLNWTWQENYFTLFNYLKSKIIGGYTRWFFFSWFYVTSKLVWKPLHSKCEIK